MAKKIEETEEEMDETMEQNENAGEFSEGWDSIPEESSSTAGLYLNPKDGESAQIQFISKQPIIFKQHVLQVNMNGKLVWRYLTCSKNGCPLCEAGHPAKAVGAFEVLHIDNVEEGGKVVPKAKLFVKGPRVLRILANKNKKKPIYSVPMNIERIGGGTDTQYQFEFDGDIEVPKNYTKLPKTIKELLAPNLEFLRTAALDYSASNFRGGNKAAGKGVRPAGKPKQYDEDDYSDF